MKTSHPLTLGLPLGAVLALLGTHFAQGPQDAAAAPPKGPVIGVVDFVRVFENYSKFAKAQGEIAELAKQHQGELDKEAANLDEMEVAISKLAPDTRQRAELELQYKTRSEHLKGVRNIYSVEIQRAELQARVDGYADIEKAIEQVAKDKKIDLILRQRNDPGTDSPLVRQQAYQARNVWYADKKLDLTQAVIDALKVLPSGQGGEK